MYTHDISRAFSDVVGKEGAEKSVFTAALAETGKAIAELGLHRADGSWPVLTTPEREDDLAEIEAQAKHIAEHFSDLVVVGMGGSSRGAKTLVALRENPFTHKASGTAVHFVDNIDPHTSEQLLAALDIKTTCFLIISKSGDTAETLAHMLVLFEAAETKLGKGNAAKHFMAITQPGDSALRRIAAAQGISISDHDPNIGGRFSVLTNVGLLPAAVAGIDIRAVRAGAAEILKTTFTQSTPEVARGAALHHALVSRGKPISLMMPYCDRLDAFGAWYQQIWAESLGKKGKGTTPLRALGALDQHSQLQLYLDGPRDKFITLILPAHSEKGPAIPQPPDATLAYLNGHTIGNLMDAEGRATAETLTRRHCPLRLITLPRLDEHALGALLMHFMLETILLAKLWRINPFDQPAVEESKRLTRTYLMQSK